MDKVLTWNIGGGSTTTGMKTEESIFKHIRRGFLVVCLQETSVETSYKGYISHSDLRKSGKGGGVTTLVHRSISRHCESFKIDVPDDLSLNIAVLKYTDQSSQELYIINVYVPPSNSRRKCTSSDDFDFLTEVITSLSIGTGEVIICGNFNARIGLNNEFYESQDLAHHVDLLNASQTAHPSNFRGGGPVGVKRCTQDPGTNSHKNHLLNMIDSCDLLILNGRTLGDSKGSFTCFKYNGNSVVDYFICNVEAVNQVISLQVLDHTHQSDHSPVSLCLWTCFTSKDKLNVPSTYAAPFRYQISSKKLNVFKNDISSKDVEGKI